jgi:hypothetical protein
MRPITHYFAPCTELSAEEFVRLHPGPFFVHSSANGGHLQPSAGGRTIDMLVVPDTAPQSSRDGAPEVLTIFTVRDAVAASSDGSLTIGSGGFCHLRVAAASVSRLHARLRREDGAWLIEDAGSAAGTWKNGDAVEAHARCRLAPGDRVSLGTIDLTFYPSLDFRAYVRALVAR